MLSDKIVRLSHEELLKYRDDLKRRINELSTGSPETSLSSLGILSTGGISTAAANTNHDDSNGAVVTMASSSKQSELHWDHVLKEMVRLIYKKHIRLLL